MIVSPSQDFLILSKEEAPEADLEAHQGVDQEEDNEEASIEEDQEVEVSIEEHLEVDLIEDHQEEDRLIEDNIVEEDNEIE